MNEKKIFFNLLFVLVIALLNCNCHTPIAEDFSCEKRPVTLRILDFPGSVKVGTVFFNVEYQLCKDYFDKKIWLQVSQTEGGYYLGYTECKWEDYQGELLVHHYFPKPGRYAVNVLVGTESNKNMKRSGTYYVQVEASDCPSTDFKIIQLAMEDDELWPNDLTHSYLGETKRDNAFADANIHLCITNNYEDLSKAVDANGEQNNFSERDKAEGWAYRWAYGPDYLSNISRINPKITLLCSIDDGTFEPEPAAGVCILPDIYHTVPPICFLFNNRINNVARNEYDKVRLITGVALHELGHALGIIGDAENIIPPHSGDFVSTCIMQPNNSADSYTNPKFCTGHKNYLSNQTWYK